jgi:hypothetical protein
MKHKLLYLIAAAALLMVGCFKSPSSIANPTTNVVSGTFTGQFRLLHRSNDKVPFDTTKCNITLTLNSSTGAYTVTGDTTTVHAGSYGNYGVSAPYIQFVDATYPKSGTPTKTHLNGIYQYYYDGTVFQMLAYSIDTLSLQYDLKKAQ